MELRALTNSRNFKVLDAMLPIERVLSLKPKVLWNYVAQMYALTYHLTLISNRIFCLLGYIWDLNICQLKVSSFDFTSSTSGFLLMIAFQHFCLLFANAEKKTEEHENPHKLTIVNSTTQQYLRSGKKLTFYQAELQTFRFNQWFRLTTPTRWFPAHCTSSW